MHPVVHLVETVRHDRSGDRRRARCPPPLPETRRSWIVVPGVVLVCELAHANLTGGRHARGWQEVGELSARALASIDPQRRQDRIAARQRLAAETGLPYVVRRHLPVASRERYLGKFPFRSGRRLRDRGDHGRAGGWLRKCVGEAAIVPHAPHRTPVPACDRHMRRIVSLRQLAVQQGVDPHIGTPGAIRGVWLRLGTRRRPGRGGPLGGGLQRLFEGPGRHEVVLEPPGVCVLSHHDVEPWLRLGTRRRPGRGGPLGGGLQRLFEGPGRHEVVLEPPGVRVLSHRNVEQWHRPSTSSRVCGWCGICRSRPFSDKHCRDGRGNDWWRRFEIPQLPGAPAGL